MGGGVHLFSTENRTDWLLTMQALIFLDYDYDIVSP